MNRIIKRSLFVLLISLFTQVSFTSCEEDSEIFDNIETQTDEHNEKKQKPKGL